MASVVSTEPQAKVTAAPQQKAAPHVEVAAPNRREFLYYIWGASIAMLLGGSGAALIWFALPRFAEGTFGGVFNIAPDRIPQPDAPPTQVPEGRFWISNTPDSAVVVLYGVCTHLGCLPKWSQSNHRFECPCHGSKFELNGRYIEGPAPRSLDRFETTVTFTDGSSAVSNAIGDPIPLNGRSIANVAVNTGRRLRRAGTE
ncbi:MAG: ubiquinol-cytochrome c reductase iron-sulfur subunit [bacterium]|nr:ubiquinol-cytochrome c reductase iron-sulfur subunit [bacterium]